MPKKASHQHKRTSPFSQILSAIQPAHIVSFATFAGVLLVWWAWQSTVTEQGYGWPAPVAKTDDVISVEATSSPTPYPRLKTGAQEPPYLTAQAAIALDSVSGAIFYAKNERMQFWPASTTKLMTALVALELYDPDDIITVRNPLTEGSIMGLLDGEQISVENLLYGLLIHSANDAAYALARQHEEGMSGFVEDMNDKAVEIGLENTHFFNPAGFDNEKQFTTVLDLSRLTRIAMQNRTVLHMVGIPAITVSDSTFTHFHELKNVNQLLGTVPGVAGVKTGWTENAKENLINLTKRDGQSVITIVLGSNDRFGETVQLTEWVFNNTVWNVNAVGGTPAPQTSFAE